jgi:hypothetical protein
MVVTIITKPEISRKYGRAFIRAELIFSFEIPRYKILNTTRIGIRTPSENNPKAPTTFSIDIAPV